MQGRFFTRDTFAGNPEVPISLNLYNYAHSNPVRYTDPTGHDIIVVGGGGGDEFSGGKDPYDDPLSWEPWIRDYTGWTHQEFMDKWYTRWTAKESGDYEKMRIAQETGVAVFKWKNVPGASQLGNATEAARVLQEQIDAWELKDVTAVGHSKGGLVLASLMTLYEEGKLARGAVKNTVLIDPPQHPIGDVMGGQVDVDAMKAGVKAGFLPGIVACGPISFICRIGVRNAVVFQYHLDHELHGEMAGQVFDALNICGDAHARSRVLCRLLSQELEPCGIPLNIRFSHERWKIVMAE